MRLELAKWQGCGNDFLILDVMGQPVPEFRQDEIRFLCDRHYGVGADGLIVLQSSSDATAAWQFFNDDGSSARMCGNAARCAIRYLRQTGRPEGNLISLMTGAGIVKGKVLEDERVEITLLPQVDFKVEYEEVRIRVGDQALDLMCIDTGVPHAVMEVSAIHGYPIDDIGRSLVRHPAFGDQGTNVTFFQRTVGKRILATTFERGVERETLACGTGAAAAGLLFAERYLEHLPVDVAMPGGEVSIDFSSAHRLLLRGPAVHVGNVEVTDLSSHFETRLPFGRRKKS